MPLPIGMLGKLGLPGIILMIVVLFLSNGGLGGLTGGGGGFNIDNPLQQVQPPPSGDGSAVPGEDQDQVEFVSFVLDDIQAMWETQFGQAGQEYRRAKLVLFTDGVQTACGSATAASGPFYCPGDERVYLDLSFFDELSTRFGAPGDFAGAYVIAHEIGHHVQFITGIEPKVRQESSKKPNDANELSVKLELQADCLAGVWAYSTFQRDLLESGDIEEGLGAAAAVGDDRLQKQAGGRVNPETWTHGSSEQRVSWFKKGFESGQPSDCNTFD